ncbi:hypothetical protein [Enterovirga aerilata]|uniref:Restriction endonuclease n=1 Tax=Enterovirga aerilata TaxID=2730920 RepID=A0A849IJW7_9HYPH|nr:hypothetical protein [Enterovirga sp. DB1703]NNM74233.1 hypothetical protein [Enterovirga sp. DB1703]
MAPGALKGYLLEEVVAFLISKAGYRLLVDPEDDPVDLDRMGNGLQVRGRGGFHQADVLGELSWAPAFGNPIRLFIEAKWRGESRSRVGIPEVRHAVGILEDINHALVTVRARRTEEAPEDDGDDVRAVGRGFCYTYRYALCSTSGFSAGAQAYALAHQIALFDLSHGEYEDLRLGVDGAGDQVQRYLQGLHAGRDDREPGTRRKMVARVRDTLRQELWGGHFPHHDPQFVPLLRPAISAAQDIGELFVGVSATGFVLLLKADSPELMNQHMLAPQDPQAAFHFDAEADAASNWRVTLSSPGIERCKLYFTLPDAMLLALQQKREAGRRTAALSFKEEHFSRLTVYRITPAKSMVCSLKLDRNWLDRARARIEGSGPRVRP